MTTRTGNTTYGHYSNAGAIYDLSVNTAPRYVIWDAGGFDTINLELATGAVEIDLRPGAFSSYGGGDHFVFGARDGADQVQDFQPGSGRLHFTHLGGYAELAFTRSAIIAGNTMVTPVGVDPSTFAASDFLFG